MTRPRHAFEVGTGRAAVGAHLAKCRKRTFAIRCRCALATSLVRHALAKRGVEMVAPNAQYVVDTDRSGVNIRHALAENFIEMTAPNTKNVVDTDRSGINVWHALAESRVEVIAANAKYVVNTGTGSAGSARLIRTWVDARSNSAACRH